MSDFCISTAKTVQFSSLVISDMKNLCSFIISHPLYFSYIVFFSPYLLKILSFLFPLVFTTSLLLVAFLTVSPGLIISHHNNKFSPENKVGSDLFSVFHAVVECLRSKVEEECFDLEDFEVYKIVFVGTVVDCVQENQQFDFSEQNSVQENSAETEDSEQSLVDETSAKTGDSEQSIVENSAKTGDSKQSLVDEDSEKTGDSEQSIVENSAKTGDGSAEKEGFLKKLRKWEKMASVDNVNEKKVEKMASVNYVNEKKVEKMTSVNNMHEKKAVAHGAEADKVVVEYQKELSKVRNGSEEANVNNNKTKTTSIATRPESNQRVMLHSSPFSNESSKTLDYNNVMISNGSMRKEKEWKRTLACKLYEERNTPDCSGGGEGMDLLWETHEMDATKTKAAKKRAEVKRYINDDDDDDEEDDEVVEMSDGLCCLQALKFSGGKVNLGMGRPSLVKISKAIKGFGWLHHVTKHSKKVVHIGDRF